MVTVVNLWLSRITSSGFTDPDVGHVHSTVLHMTLSLNDLCLSSGSFKCSGSMGSTSIVAPFWHGHLDHLYTLGRRCAFPACLGLAAKQACKLEVSHVTLMYILPVMAPNCVYYSFVQIVNSMCCKLQALCSRLLIAAAAAAAAAGGDAVLHTMASNSRRCTLTVLVLCRLSMSTCSLFLLLAAAIYAAGGILARQGPDYREVVLVSDDDSVNEATEESGHLRLLNEEEESDRTAAPV